MKASRCITAIVALFLFTNLFATPSTQIWIPSTDVQKFMNPHFGWDVYLGQNGSGIISNGGITIGVLPFEKVGLEIGVDYRDLSGNHIYPFYFNAKLGVPEDALFKYMPAVAVGIYDLGFIKGKNDYNLLYGLLAKTLGPVGRFSVGGYYAVGDTLLMGYKDDEAKPGLLASWDKAITDKVWASVDFQSGTNYYSAVSFGASWAFAPNASVILGYDYYLKKDVPGTITMQVDFNLK
jgi:hypothetical protein